MKYSLPCKFPFRIILAVVLSAVKVIANSGTWNGTTDANWATPGNWSANSVPGMPDTATFNNAGNNKVVLNLGTGVTIGNIVFDTASAAAYTIGSGGASNQSLTLSGNGSIVVNSTVVTNELFNANFSLSTANGDRTIIFSNGSTANGQSLTFAGAFNTARTGTKTIAVSGNGQMLFSGGISDGTGVLAITKAGTNVLTLSGNNTFSGSTVVHAGTVLLSGTGGSAAATATLTVADTVNASAVVKIVAGANVTNYSLVIGGTATGAGAVYQSGGTFTQVQGANIANFRLGGGANDYGYYQLAGGTLNANEIGVGSDLAGSVGVMDITGGNYFSSGYVTLARGVGSVGALNVSGGTMTLSGTTANSVIGLMWNGSGSSVGVVNINQGGTIIGPNNTTYTLNYNPFNSAGTAQAGIVNLGTNGTLQIGGVQNSLPGTGLSLLNFDGGTLKATVANASYFSNALSGAYVFDGGAVIDDNGTAITVAQPLLAPTGNGVAAIALTSGGSGYIGAPFVSISGDGTGATAMAQFNPVSGAVTNVVVTSPGNNYTTATVTLIGGGGTGATIGTVTLAANASGGLTKKGAGTLTLSGANTYTGATLINAGTLALGTGGSLASTNITTSAGTTFDVSAISFNLGANQSLLGSGTNAGAIGMVSGSKIYAGTDGGFGTNTFTSNLTFAAGAMANFDLGATSSSANDLVVLNGASSVLTGGGASVGIKCGANLDRTNDYTLFVLTGGSASITGSFSATPVWTGTIPASAGAYTVVNVGNKVMLHFSSGTTNLPAVTNLAASGVLTSAATLNGQVVATGGQIPSIKIYYGPSNGGTNAAAWATNVALGLQGGLFAAAISNLTGNTTYYFTAVASNAAGAVWAAPSQSFTTPGVNLAVVTNLPASNVQGSSAILNGQVLAIGSATPSVTLYYGPANGGTNAASWANNIYIGPQSGAYAITVTGLNTNTVYYFTAAAANVDGTGWAQPAGTFTTLPTAPVVSVLTYHYDNARTGANTNETLLTPATVNTNNFGRLIKYVTDGYMYTEPLYVPGVQIPGQGTHNVIYAASEHGTVYAFDADSNAGANGGLLWQTNLGIVALSASGEFGARYCGTCFPDIIPEVGITGTPVIDPVTGTLYVNVFTREVVVGVSTNYVHRIHALNVTNGTERAYSPVVVGGSVPGTGRDSSGGVMTFNPKQNNQRAALTLAGGKLYVVYAGYADTDPYHGWVMAYNASNLTQTAIFNTTPNASTAAFGTHAAEGGIWMGGHGLVVDANTNLYFETGNGSFSANTNGGDYADSFMKLATTNGLTIADYFTPYNQLTLANADTDLGSVGPVLLPDNVGSAAHPHLLVGGGKSGTLYLLDRDNLGHYNGTDGVNGNNSQIVQSVIGATKTIWSSAAYFNNQLYYQGASDTMKAFVITNGVIVTNAASVAAASVGTYNGGPVVSANGTNNGIVWVLNNNSGNGAAVLYACNATNLAQQLYNSSQLARDNPGNGIKMTTPTVVNGKVYVGAQYALSVFGFTGFLATPVISPNGAVFTNSVTVTLTEATPGAAIYYTLDGTTPTTSSLLYTAPLVVTTTLNLQAMAVKSGAANSGVASASFVNTAALGSGTGLRGQYWTNTTSAAFTNAAFATLPTLTRTDAVVNFNWSTNAPAASIGRTNFTASWTGSVQPQYTEAYTFTVVADDGVRLWVNGQLLVNDWTTRTTTATNSGVISLTAQQLYNLRLDYFQGGSNASVALLWSGPSTALAIVPQTQLYPFTNPPPSVVMLSPADTAGYTAAASVTLSADADAPFNPVTGVSFYANSTFLGSVSNVPYTLTATGLAAGGYALRAVATDGSGLSSTSAVVNITVTAGSGQPYGLTTNGNVAAFLNMPTAFNGSLPVLLSGTGAFADTTNRVPAGGMIPYTPNTALWSDGAVKSRLVAVPNNGGLITPDEQIGFAATGSWTFPAGTVFVKNFDLVVDETNTNVPLRRLETRLLVRDINGGVYGVTYKWRANNLEADLLSGSLNEDILVTNATGVRTQTWYYPSPADCLTCHTPAAGYVLGLSTRQLNGSQTYPATGNTDNQLRTFNRLGLFNPAVDEAAISSFAKMSALTNATASLQERVRSYLDANCAQCHRPGGSGITFDARYDTPLANQNLTNYPAALSLGYDHARIIAPKDVWRSVIYQRMNSVDGGIKMPPLARSLVDSNAVAVLTAWINSLPGVPALAPPVILPNGGSFVASVTVALQSPDTNAAVYYTLDGSLPTTNSFLYAGAFNLLNNATVSASAFETGFNNSVTAGALFLVQPLSFTTAGFGTNHLFQLGFSGTAGGNYVLEATTNFANWMPLSTNTPTNNFFNLTDPAASNFPFRFYRVRQQ